MAKANPNPGSKFIRFLCSRCGSKARAPLAMAGKFMDCPNCKQRTPVPNSQAEADEEARILTVQENYYEAPEKCTKCGRKMKKGAVVCLNCGFNYKAGKQLETEDMTVQPHEKRRGGPALQMAILCTILLFIDIGIFIFRIIQDKKYWWEQGLYLSGMLNLLAFIPGAFMQWWNYRDLPIRDTPDVKEINRAERQEAMQPLGDWTGLVTFLNLLIAMLIMFFVFSRNDQGKLVIPFMSEN